MYIDVCVCVCVCVFCFFCVFVGERGGGTYFALYFCERERAIFHISLETVIVEQITKN